MYFLTDPKYKLFFSFNLLLPTGLSIEQTILKDLKELSDGEIKVAVSTVTMTLEVRKGRGLFQPKEISHDCEHPEYSLMLCESVLPCESGEGLL